MVRSMGAPAKVSLGNNLNCESLPVRKLDESRLQKLDRKCLDREKSVCVNG